MSEPVDELDELVELQPEEPQVLQEETAPATDVPVCVTRVLPPVRVQALPPKAATVRTYTVSTTVPRKVLAADHYRAGAWLISTAEDFYYAFSRQGCLDASTRGIVPQDVRIPITATVEVWIMSAAAALPATVTVHAERWATGE